MMNINLHIKTLRARLFILISTIVLLTIITIIYFVHLQTDKAMFMAQQENAKNVLTSVKLNIVNEYKSIKFYENRLKEIKKEELKNLISIVNPILYSNYSKYKNGFLSLANAKRNAINEINSIRYDDGIGYFWINDTYKPIPYMIMHPTLPELNGKLLDDPKFNCALGKNENLFKAFVDVCEKDGEGYVDYLWPKPTQVGLTERQPKLSFVKKFEPWNWIIGTGVYIDDISFEVEKRKNTVIQEVKETLSKIELGENGYLFIFTSDLNILIHPNYENTPGDSLINPVTGGKILEELIESSKKEEKIYNYSWPIPGNSKDKLYRKRAYIDYFEPLDWYIVSSVYLSEVEKPANELQTQIFLITAFFLIIAFIVSLLASQNITKPIKTLVDSAKQFQSKKVLKFEPQKSASIEIQELSKVLIDSFNSIKTTTDALRKSEDRLNKSLMATKDGIFDVDLITKETYFDPMYYKIAGYEPNEFAQETTEWRKRIHPDDYEYVDNKIQKHLANKTEDYEAEYRFKSKDGKWIWIQGRGQVIERDNNGKALRFIGSHTDITQRKIIEEKLKMAYELNLKYQETISEIAMNFALQTENFDESCKIITEIAAKELGVDRCGIWSINLQTEILECITLYEKQSNCHSKNKSLSLKKHPSYFKALNQKNAIDASDAINDPRTCEFKDSYLIPLGIKSLLDAQINLAGKLMGVICFESIHEQREWLPEEITFATRIADQTALALLNSKRLETNEKLRKSDEELRTANEELQSILYVASHDLRSPLVNIAGFSSEVQILIEDIEKLLMEKFQNLLSTNEYLELKSDLNESMKLIHLNTVKMNTLLSGLLRLSRLGKSALTMHMLDVKTIVENTIMGMNYQINSASASIEVGTLPQCYCDETLLNQIFSNLIDNAIKYLDPNKKGKIKISGAIENENHIIYCVEDNGIGIAKAHQEKIFEIFHRLHPESSVDGVGIGLTIIQKMLKKLNGSIWIESEPSIGSKFFFKLPANEFISE